MTDETEAASAGEADAAKLRLAAQEVLGSAIETCFIAILNEAQAEGRDDLDALLVAANAVVHLATARSLSCMLGYIRAHSGESFALSDVEAVLRKLLGDVADHVTARLPEQLAFIESQFPDTPQGKDTAS
jgi:hypothetical protein